MSLCVRLLTAAVRLITPIVAVRITVAVRRVRHTLAVLTAELADRAARSLLPAVIFVRGVGTVDVAVAVAALVDAASVAALELAGSASGLCVTGSR